jgi:hypothetical protein
MSVIIINTRQEDLLADISGRIHARKESKVGMYFDGLVGVLVNRDDVTFQHTPDTLQVLIQYTAHSTHVTCHSPRVLHAKLD